MKTVQKIALYAAAVLGFSSAATSADLSFDIDKPFRFFKFESDYAVQKIAFDLLKGAGTADQVTVERLEKELADPAFWVKNLTEDAWVAHKWPLRWRKYKKDKDEKFVDAKTRLRVIDVVANLRAMENRPVIEGSVKPFVDGGRWTQVDALEIVRRYGWAALLDTHLVESRRTRPFIGVCWDSLNRNHGLCGADYIASKSWRVRVYDPRLFRQPLDKVVDAKCEWQFFESKTREKKIEVAEKSVGDGKLSCAEIYIRVPAISGAGETPRGFVFGVRKNEDGSETPVEVSVTDRLVVGIGDSFASGEGNPDRPVVLHPTYVSRDPAVTNPDNIQTRHSFREFPRRPNDNFHWAAHWVDRSCHRSVYSWQVRSPLHAALSDPSNAITYLGFACSGAEVVEGLLFAHAGVEPIKDRPNVGQIAAIYNELCGRATRIGAVGIPDHEADWYLNAMVKRGRKDNPWTGAAGKQTAARLKAMLNCAGGSKFSRPLNAMLLSVGGNDLGFAKWIMATILHDDVEGLPGGFIPCKTAGCDKLALTNARIARLDARYDLLKEVLLAKLLKDGALKPDKVLMTGYLKAVFQEKGKYCEANNAGMTVSLFEGVGTKLFEVRKQTDLDAIEKFREGELMRMVREFASSTKSDGANVKLVEKFIDEFDGRGYCATPNTGEHRKFAVGELRESFSVTNPLETLHFPRSAGGWTPLRVDQWRPYASRKRLLRTPNDTFMTVNNKLPNTREDTPFGLADLPWRATSGAFHPTAEAHSIIAKHVAPELRAVLARD